MEEIMSFILNHWFTIILICIIILMIIIGYYVDANNLVNKPKKKLDDKNNLDIPVELEDKENNISANNGVSHKKNNDGQEFFSFERPNITKDETLSNNDNKVKLDVQKDIIKQQAEEEFDQYFEQVLQKKPIITDDIKNSLEDIKDLPEEINSTDDYVSTDIVLPDIKEKELETDTWF